jgi:hypothetical protein
MSLKNVNTQMKNADCPIIFIRMICLSVRYRGDFLEGTSKTAEKRQEQNFTRPEE